MSRLVVKSATRRCVRLFGLSSCRLSAQARQSLASQRATISSYCPIYSTQNDTKVRQNYCLFNTNETRRLLANTTFGSFAPSKLSSNATIRQTSEHSSATNGACPTSVFDESASDNLPPLPVPCLNETLERLRETIWPIAMNSAEFAAALELIERFSKSAGPKLDLLLRAKANQTKNWLTHDWWTQEAYLKLRSPLVINSNPAIIYPQLPYEINNQRQLINTVAQLISGLIEFKFALQSGYNPEATSESSEFRLDPNLCYSQYRNIFGMTRNPGESIDEQLLDPAPTAQHQPFKFVLSFRGNFYEFCLSPEANDHEQTRIDTLVNLLNKLFDAHQQQQQTTELGAGLLTTGARDQWARTRKLLNAQSLTSIEQAQFLVCLDSIPSSTSFRQQSQQLELSFIDQLNDSPLGSRQHLEALSRQVLHADQANVANRWFDKSLQLIIVSDQTNQRYLGAGINYEHSVAEAVVVTKMLEYSYDKTVANHNRQQQRGCDVNSNSAASSSCVSSFNLLQLTGDDATSSSSQTQLNEALKQAQRDYLAHVTQFDLAYFKYKPYGANSIKSWRFSPDSWFQVALQLAHYQLHKRLVPCYESASTRSFAFGRTETIRSLTKDVAQFCQQPQFSTMQAAIQSHKSYANAANNAAAIDRVLMGYRLVFNELKFGTWSWAVPTLDPMQSNRGHNHQVATASDDKKSTIDLNDLFTEQEIETLGAFFNNELIERSKKFSLSTSQVASAHPDVCMSYGPYLADGYACCYNITGQQIVAAITANSANSSFSSEVNKFSESLCDSLDRMRKLVEEQKRKS